VKRKLQLSSFDVSPPERLEIRMRETHALGLADHNAPQAPVQGAPAPGVETEPFVLTRTFARGKWAEGKRQSSAI
jgi:hypothetical protein